MDLFNKKKITQLESEIANLKGTLEQKNYDIEGLRNTNEHLANVLNNNGELKIYGIKRVFL